MGKLVILMGKLHLSIILLLLIHILFFIYIFPPSPPCPPLPGLSSGYEKLSLHLGHRNPRVKEQVLQIVYNLVCQYRDKDVDIQNLCKKLIFLLADTQPSIKNLAAETIAQFSMYLGDSFFKSLESLGLHGIQLKMVKDALDKNKNVTLGGGCKLISNYQNSATTTAISESKSIIHMTKSLDGSIHGKEDKVCKNSLPIDTISSKYTPSTFLNLLFEGPSVSPIKLYTDKDLEKNMNLIVANLSKSDDWEARMKALGMIQGLTIGDAMEYDTFPGQIRGIHDILINQIIDLRSTLSKEACRTIAVLARYVIYKILLIQI